MVINKYLTFSRETENGNFSPAGVLKVLLVREYSLHSMESIRIESRTLSISPPLVLGEQQDLDCCDIIRILLYKVYGVCLCGVWRSSR